MVTLVASLPVLPPRLRQAPVCSASSVSPSAVRLTFIRLSEAVPQFRRHSFDPGKLIRGLSPYPAAWSELVSPEGEAVVMKIFESEKIYEAHQLPVGTVMTDGKKYIKVAVPDGFVSVLSLQLPGKKRLKTDELLRGFRLSDGYKMN